MLKKSKTFQPELTERFILEAIWNKNIDGVLKFLECEICEEVQTFLEAQLNLKNTSKKFLRILEINFFIVFLAIRKLVKNLIKLEKIEYFIILKKVFLKKKWSLLGEILKMVFVVTVNFPWNQDVHWSSINNRAFV